MADDINNNTVYTLSGKKITGNMIILNNGDCIVLKGSTLSNNEAHSCPKKIKEIRKMLIEDGTITRVDDQKYCFIMDYKFSSPSYAASVLLGSSINGLSEWKANGGRTIKEIQRKLI